MMRLFDHFRNRSEQRPLQPQPPAVNSKLTRFLKSFLNLTANTIDATGSFDSNWVQYQRVIQHCMPAEELCSQTIELQSSYIALSAAAINFTLQIIAQRVKTQQKIPAQLILKCWNAIVDILGMHYFYLGFILFMHTLSLRGMDETTYQEKEKVLQEIFWGAEVAPCILIAILSNSATRNQLRKLCVGALPRGIIAKMFDTFFELLRGFAITRGIIFGVQEIIQMARPELNTLTSPASMTVRYVPSGLYALYQSYQGWQQPPSTDTHMLFNKKLRWPHIIENSFTALYFLLFTGFTVAETTATHRTVLIICFSILFTAIFGYSYFSTRLQHATAPAVIANVENQNDDIAPSDSSRDQQSLQALIANPTSSPVLTGKATRPEKYQHDDSSPVPEIALTL